MEAIFKAFTRRGKQPEFVTRTTTGHSKTRRTGWIWTGRYPAQNGWHSLCRGTVQSRIRNTMSNSLKERLKHKIKGKQPRTDKTKYQCSDLTPQVMTEYDTTNKHRITGMTPVEARKPSSEADAKMAMSMVAIRGRTFPILQVGDIVRILKKKKLGDEAFMEQFKAGKNTVESISENFGQKLYL